MKGTKEFYEIMDQFEKEAKTLFYGHKIERVGKQEKVPAGIFYNDGYVNEMFKAFISGYQFHKNVSMTDEQYGEQQHADDMDQQQSYSELRRGG